jgi:hypothetical protein
VVSSDGDRSMTGQIQCLLTRIDTAKSPGKIRAWCGLHLLDFFMQNAYKKALEDELLGT